MILAPEQWEVEGGGQQNPPGLSIVQIPFYVPLPLVKDLAYESMTTTEQIALMSTIQLMALEVWGSIILDQILTEQKKI